MDFLQFLASVINSLAWPGLVLALVWTLKKPVIELLPHLKLLKAKDYEFHFERKLNKAEEDLAQVPPPAVDALPPPEASPAPDRSELERSPHHVVADAWRKVEGAILETANRAVPRPSGSPSVALRSLNSLRLIPPSVNSAIQELRELRNLAMHGDVSSISADQAARYWETSKQIVAQLRALPTRTIGIRFFHPDKVTRAAMYKRAQELLPDSLGGGSWDSAEPPYYEVRIPAYDLADDIVEQLRQEAAGTGVTVEVGPSSP